MQVSAHFFRQGFPYGRLSNVCQLYRLYVRAVQTPGFSPPAPEKKTPPPGEKTPAPAENMGKLKFNRI